MQNKNFLWLGIGIVVAIALAASFFFLGPHSALAPTQNPSTQTGSTTATSLGNGVSVGTTNGNVTVTEMPLSSGIQAPNLDYTVAYSSSLPSDAVSALKTQIATLASELKKDPSQSDNWLQLAIDYKIAGDYDAAAAVWIYLTKVAPTSYIAYGDLGDLYMNFQINYPKAEANYLQAIALDPHVIDYYRDLYTLYTSFYKTNTTAAADIVTQGLKANPNNPDLLKLQSQLKTSPH
ncbi:MAG: tetratricopeptide repeat protein [Minisyncoccia bacterium]|jgi:tetratricopeptide (TPR) repeat protein